MNQVSENTHKARSFVARAAVLAVTLAISLGACVYPYGRGGGEGWRHGGERGFERR
jgi:hypothetical protein